MIVYPTLILMSVVSVTVYVLLLKTQAVDFADALTLGV